MTYMCSYLSKNRHQCLQTMKDVVKEIFDKVYIIVKHWENSEEPIYLNVNDLYGRQFITFSQNQSEEGCFQ